MDRKSPHQFPLNNSLHILFNGDFNGFGVEVKSLDQIGFLYHLGCFGKGSASRSRPNIIENDGSPSILRKRQFVKRNYWYRKFEKTKDRLKGDSFFNHVDELMSKLRTSKNQCRGEVIDLVSTDDNEEGDEDFESSSLSGEISHNMRDKQNISVIVPNSDSEDDNYFSSMKPKSCLNRIKLEEKLMLTLQESFFLVYGLGCLEIKNLDGKVLNIQDCWDLFRETDENFSNKYIVYHYFRSKGYVVKPGIKFGGDYLLYKDGPGIHHADYIVVIKSEEKNFEWISLLGHVRMANTTVKEVMIAEVFKPAKDNIKLPDGLCEFRVHETVLTRNIPAAINNDDE